ncbi:MAG: FtsQ-type POTRA domain-containing protein [Proteobacteria bacterium]|nr:FtsQ-type POTRA domain-containing protein [Pseudomonadota bacterium]MBU4100513.1 FtsQ-type POTRA domain-containing protein [Pseudomonadota bacterium]MBU4419767.1 FtsQ-type POTRA domain-containing protein [Pseudomonadota bacterium]
MLGNNHIRKNHYKGTSTKRRVRILQRFIFCFEMVAVVAILTVMSFVFILGHDFVTQCDYFRADNITIRGVHRLSKQQILEQANINKGINILSVNLSIIRNTLLAHPWIAEAEVRRELPNIISIGIKEHKPLAILDLGRKFLINVNGEVFKELTASDPDALPIVSGLQFSDLNIPGESRSTSFDAVMEVLRFGQKPDSILPNRIIRKIRVDRQIGLTLFAFDRGRAIKLGYHDYIDKYKRLESVLFYLKEKRCFPDFNSIDLNHLDRIVVNLVKDELSAGDHKEV